MPAALVSSIAQALQSTLSICAFVTFFAVVLRLLALWGVIPALANLLGLFGIGPEWAGRMAAGLLELSSGVSSLSGGQGLTGRTSMAAFMLGWAGISVHCQVLSFLADSGLSGRTYLTGKLLHGLLAAALTWLVTRFIPLDEPVSSYLIDQTESIAALDFSSALTGSILTACGCWLLLAAISAVLVRKKCGKLSRHRI